MIRNYTNPRSELWDRVYDVCTESYRSIRGFEDYDSRVTADIAADNWYASGPMGGNPRLRRFGPLAMMPDPGDMLPLGDFMQLEWVLADGTIHGMNIDYRDHIPLYWSDDLQALFILPYARTGACVHPPRPREARLLAVWARGRAATCSAPTQYSRPPLPVVAPGVQVSYRSDKFGKRGEFKNYIHHFDSRGVLCRFSSQPFNARRAPEATMIRGGDLRLTTHGIAG